MPDGIEMNISSRLSVSRRYMAVSQQNIAGGVLYNSLRFGISYYNGKICSIFGHFTPDLYT